MGINQTPAKEPYIGFSPYAPTSTSAYFDLFNCAYRGKLDSFKIIASRYDDRGDGLAITIPRLKDKLGRGSLIFAAAGGSVNVCRYLIEELNLDIDVEDNHGGTPLCYAAVKAHMNSVEYLLEKGANPNGSDDPNSTFNAPLHYAVLGGDTNIQTLLLFRGARVNFVTAAGTALHCAAGRNQLDSVKLLLDHHADPNVVFQGLITPLAASIVNGSLQMMNLLLQAGANPNAESCGIVPLRYALDYGLTNFVTILREAGADPNDKCAIKPEGSEKVLQEKIKGAKAFQEKQYALAVMCFSKALEIAPTDATLLSNRSACYACMQDGDKALKDATECISLKPDWPMAHYMAGIAFNILERHVEATQAFYKGLKLDPEHKELDDAFRCYGGTFIMAIKCLEERVGVVTGESRTTRTVRQMISNETLVDVSRAQSYKIRGRIFEQRSSKIHCIGNSVIAAAGNRRFNTIVKDQMLLRSYRRDVGFDGNENPEIIARVCCQVMSYVWRRYFSAHIRKNKSRLCSAFIIVSLDRYQNPVIKQVSINMDYRVGYKREHTIRISPSEPKYSFAGDIDLETDAALRVLLDSTVTGNASPSFMKVIAFECTTMVTAAAERSKVDNGDATVGGWLDGWTIGDLESVITIPDFMGCSHVDHVRTERCNIDRFDWGKRIDGSATVTSVPRN